MEYWDLYDCNQNKLFKKHLRGKIMKDGEYHLVVSGLIKHIDGDYLLVQRSYEKKDYPGLYEASCGGSVLSGEKTIEAIKRETFEETGIIPIKCNLINEDISDSSHSIFKIFLIETDIEKDKIKLQKGETINYKWVNAKELLDYFESGKSVLNQKKRLADYFDILKDISNK